MRSHIPHEVAIALGRRWADEASTADDALIDAWLAEHPSFVPRLDALRQALPQPGEFGFQGDPDAFTDRVLLALRANAAPADHVAGTVRQRQSNLGTLHRQSAARRWTSSRVAAGALAGAVMLAAVTSLTLRHRLHSAPSQTYATVGGQLSTVQLAGGRQAILGPGTTIQVTETATDGMVVRVRGEALFDIQHDSRAPFVVQTANTVTRVLGTTFLVRQYDTDRTARVLVTEGRVALRSALRSTLRSALHGASDRSADGTSRVLTERMLAVVDDSGRVTVTPNVAVDDYTSWTTGRLVFQSTPAGEVLRELGRAYGVTLRLTDTGMAQQPLTWTVPVTKRSLTDVLNGLSDLLNAHVDRSGKTILIVPGRLKSTTAPTRDSRSDTSETFYGK
jgi:ferric-dicitrate binding protein FerR (iron transport regulator)